MCDYPNDTCGAHLMEVEDFPLCATMPTSCGSELAPVCGCDDVTYDNLCLAHAAGVDLNRQNTCEPPSPDWFKCGPIFCRRDQEYCSELLDDAGGGLWQCKPVPQCSASDSMCACLMALGCRDVFHECNDDGAGGVRFSCWWI